MTSKKKQQLENYLSTGFHGFKKEYLSDDSGFWYQKIFKSTVPGFKNIIVVIDELNGNYGITFELTDYTKECFDCGHNGECNFKLNSYTDINKYLKKFKLIK